jgi:hypothetical protein
MPARGWRLAQGSGGLAATRTGKPEGERVKRLYNICIVDRSVAYVLSVVPKMDRGMRNLVFIAECAQACRA